MVKLIKKIQTFAHQFSLWQEGSKIVVGVSGGPDSVCLLDILASLSKKKKFQLLVVHINYGLRGVDSDKDEVFVRKLAQIYNLKLEVLDAKKESQRKPTESFLRELRYDFFEKIRKENKFDLTAVAHNQDDQAETMLMRLIRGSGLLGLGSIRPKNNRIVRPLLDTSRREIMAYLKNKNLKYRLDKTNKESKYLRNKIRNKLIPLLEKEYNPILRKTLANSAGNLANDHDFILKSANKFLEKADFDKEKNAYFFEDKKFLKNHPALQKQILRKIIFNLKKNLLNIESAHLEEIIKIIKSDKNKSQQMKLKGLKINKKGDIIHMSY
ncbi:MAG: tRNA(Ile)-lysidine synthase [Candidatus Moranbacteria bacterium GW2011_GWF2_34_56]|nr:MAG: tRNA(Ile)-lysidine synthase [Candidatus Moranbacteria bacterium GW2011_GWF1_34_10]KKP64130.1 MAG: tRNA(Ile)-lysidine synthase [Candidatus Moranbacteria bacterium GW2011_GWF2_34_56]HBI17709.1 tRNA lysidine(34) synthetase TilS [Candidatus Moranbacteria bacterium]